MSWVGEDHPLEVVTEEELGAGYGLRPVLQDASPLLAGMALLMAGTGLTSTLLGVRAGLEGFSPTVTGVVLSAFYVGFLGGCLITPGTIWANGVRAVRVELRPADREDTTPREDLLAVLLDASSSTT